MFTQVYLCLPLFTRVYICDPILENQPYLGIIDFEICDLASENRPYDIFNPNGVISIML